MESCQYIRIEERVLVLASDSDPSLLENRFKESQIEFERCSNVVTLLREASNGVGALLIDSSALSSEGTATLTQFLKEQPSWSDIPLIIVAVGRSDVQSGQVHALANQLGNVTVLECPIHAQTTIGVIRSALRGRIRQYECRDLLAKQKSAVERLDLLAEIANCLLLANKPEDIADTVFKNLSAHLRLEVYFHFLFDPSAGKLHLSDYGGVPDSLAAKVEWIAIGEAVCGAAASQRKEIVVEDIQSYSEPRTAFLKHLGLTAYACFPLLSHDHLIGTLSFGTRQRSRFYPDELTLMGTVSNQFAVALERQRSETALFELNQLLEEKVRQRTLQLQETNDQMEAFSYSVSHDLRAPLRTIRGFSQALLEDYFDRLDDIGRDYLKRLMLGAEKMDILIQDLLNYSRIGRAKLTFEPVSLDQCVRNCLAQLEQEIVSRRATVSPEFPLGNVIGHAATLEQAIINLVTNALKFVAPGSKPEIEIRSEAEESFIRLRINDHGIGIAVEHQNRIFGVFERLHGSETYPGTGIGLAIVAKGITRMGGRVGVDSVLGKGSSFWIELPRAAE